MKKTIVFALTLLLLIGCRHNRAVSPRLVELDSLIAVAPDSAAALLQAIPSDSLIDPENRAYHALLLTQAKYKAYLPFSDGALDTINSTVQYYGDTHDPEKQTRSILYKGYVLEDLSRTDSALYIYLGGVELAQSYGQQRLLADLQFRIARLYQYSYTEDDNAIKYYKQSLAIYDELGDSLRSLYCLSELAALCRKTDPDSVLQLTTKAIELSLQLGNAVYYGANLTTLAGHYLYLDSVEKANSMALKTLALPALAPSTRVKALNFTCQTFALLGKPDSARKYIEQIPTPTSPSDSIDLIRSQAQLAYASGNLEEYIRLSRLSGDKAGNLIVRSLRQQLAATQSNFELERESTRHYRDNLQTTRLIVFLLGILLLVLMGTAWGLKVSARRRLEWVTAKNKLNERLNELNGQADTNNLQIKTVTQALGAVSYLGKKGSSSFKDDKYLMTVELPDEFWDDAERLVHQRLSSSLGSMADRGITLKTEEMRVLSLCLCDVPDVVIAKLMDYSNRRTVHNIKAVVAKKLDPSGGSLQDKLSRLVE